MKRTNIIFLTVSAFLSVLFGASGCQEKGPETALATMLEFAAVDFPAKSAPEKEVKVYSDGNWTVISCPEWATVSPTSGSGHGVVTVKVSDNVTGGEVGLPRTGILTIGGKQLIGQASMTLNQGGDRYAGIASSTISQLQGVSDGTLGSVKDAQAIAATTSLILIADGTGFALTDAPLAIGQKATVKGVKGFDKGLVRITNADLLDIVSGEAPSPSASPVDNIDEFAGNGAFITLDAIVGTANGAGDVGVTVPDATKTINIIDAPSSLGLSGIAHHRANITGYCFVDGNNVYIVAVDVEDRGVVLSNDVVARWLFNADTKDKNGPTFTGKAEPTGSDGSYTSDNIKTVGDNGMYVAAEEGNARLSYVSIDKTETDTKNYALYFIGKTGEPYMEGTRKGDYWLFTVNLSKTYKAGSTVHFFGITRTSNGALKYYTIEIFEGGKWIPILDLKEAEVVVDGDGNKETIKYNVEHVGSDYIDVDANYVLTADLKSPLLIRMICMANVTAGTGAYKAVADGGTLRWAGNTRTSPYIDITYEP